MDDDSCLATTRAVILDTNVFVAGGFKRRSASSRILGRVRSRELRMLWSDATRAETKLILVRIPPLSWDSVAALFRDEHRFDGTLDVDSFPGIRDRDDRKFAALAAATGAPLLTNDAHLLEHRGDSRFEVLTPAEFCQAAGED